MYPPGPQIEALDIREKRDKSGVDLINARWPDRIAISPFLVVQSNRIQYIERDSSRLKIKFDNAEAEYRRVGSDGCHNLVCDLVRGEIGGLEQKVVEAPTRRLRWDEMVVENVGGGFNDDEPAPPPPIPRARRLPPLVPSQGLSVEVRPPMPAPPAAAMMPPPAPLAWWRRILDKIF